tara:strand:- start:21228 stop:22421 length:1194 start_codon:yes stop_codon:yes gene_type:complete
MQGGREGDPESVIFRDHIGDKASLTKFLNHAVGLAGASDVIFQTGKPLYALVDGDLRRLTNYSVQPEQLEQIATLIAGGQHLNTALASGKSYAYAFNVSDAVNVTTTGAAQRLRFRLNATAIRGRDEGAMQMVLRHIRADPPKLDDVGFPEELREEIGLQQGAFFIAGETGSGKTTTFAACLRYIIEGNTPIRGNILTYEAPVEYIFDDIESDYCLVAQTEIGRDLPTFADGLVDALRRAPSLIVVGELRDKETIVAANDAAITGHPVYGTVHANNSSVIIERMVTQYPPEMQEQVFSSLSLNSRILMSQLLVKRIGGGRVCLRDWCVLDPFRSAELLTAGKVGHVAVLQKWMEHGDRARSMRRSIEIELAAGHISPETARLALKRYGYQQGIAACG